MNPIDFVGLEGVLAIQACIGLDAVEEGQAKMSDEEALSIVDQAMRGGCKSSGQTEETCDCVVKAFHELVPDDAVIAAQRAGELNTEEGTIAVLERNGTSYEEFVARGAMCVFDLHSE